MIYRSIPPAPANTPTQTNRRGSVPWATPKRIRKTALVCGRKDRFSWGAFASAITRSPTACCRGGLGKGDNIAIISPNSHSLCRAVLWHPAGRGACVDAAVYDGVCPTRCKKMLTELRRCVRSLSRPAIP